MPTSIIIKKRFCGPPNSGNGGYTAGLIAAQLPFSPEVTLRAPPPLDKPMQLVQEKGRTLLMDGDLMVAEAKVNDFQLTIPESVSYEKAQAAEKGANAYLFSALPTCFVCGAMRAKKDGLRIQPGNIGKQKVAATWIPFEELGTENGNVKKEFIWSALDCPGAWAIQDESQLYLLGRMAIQEVKPIKVKEKHIVMGWVIGSEGRKTWSGTAIYDEEGAVCAIAKATWIAIKK